ncbi:hypothetical protein [Pseudomonas sp. GM74]|uniref:hypothetical protein n=1 Tax=Pseudomonas sp. GM74 TaxID=1144336 RepID=UPI0012FC8BE4|nr:hypothetical protein [Pseudomonas sp. GM74]
MHLINATPQRSGIAHWSALFVLGHADYLADEYVSVKEPANSKCCVLFKSLNFLNVPEASWFVVAALTVLLNFLRQVKKRFFEKNTALQISVS